MLSLKLPEYSTTGKLESTIDDFFLDNEYYEPFILNLQEVAFLPITSVVFLSQFIYKRELEKQKTYLILPDSNDVKIFLFTWRFFEIIEELTGKSIFQFIFGNAKKMPETKFEINGRSYYLDISKDYFEKYYKEEQLKSLVKKGFFSLICEPFKNENQKYLTLKNQRRTWTTELLIKNVLQNKLLENIEIGSLLSNTIIFECLTNSANHPDSDHLVMGSFFDYSSEKYKSNKTNNYFTIVIWDNGESIINTLSNSIFSNQSIRANDSFEIAKKSSLKSFIRIIRNYEESENNIEHLFYDYLPSKASKKDEILISSFFPGITRKPAEIKDKLNDVNDSYSSGTGLGLALLLKAVVNDLNGSINVRTDKYLLSLSRGRIRGGIRNNEKFYFKNLRNEDKKDIDFICKASLKKYLSHAANFSGNMITIKIPLKTEI